MPSEGKSVPVNLPRITDPQVLDLLERLLGGQRRVLGDALVGSYLYGSVVGSDYDPEVSDIDTVCVLRTDLTPAQFAGLEVLHRDLVRDTPQWNDRVEVVYLSMAALWDFRTPSAAARISPHEPFHSVAVDHRWLMDWYQLREQGVPLLGPPPSALVPPIAHDEWVQAVRQHMRACPQWLDSNAGPGAQAYAILTMCRGLRACRTGDHVSKREAARWACEQIPEQAPLIRDALVWRQRSHQGPGDDGSATRERTRCFVEKVARLVS